MKRTMVFGLALALLVGPAVRAADDATAKGADAKKQADELVATAKSCLDKAKMLVGDERKDAQKKQYSAAAEAYAKALEMCPGWLMDDAGKDPWNHAFARIKRGNLWKAMQQYDKAHEEYMADLSMIPADMLDLRSYLQMTVGDSYMDEQNWIAAEEAYLKAQKIGLYGDRKVEVPEKLEKVKPLAEQQRKAMSEKAAQKP